VCLSVCILWGIKTGYQNGMFHRLWNRRDLNRMEDTLKQAIERGQVSSRGFGKQNLSCFSFSFKTTGCCC